MTKKQLILDAAIELFAKKGIESTSVQQITDKCGISKGAFYLIFKSKEELILAIIDYFMQSFLAKVDQAVNKKESGDEKLFQYYLTSFNYFNEYKSLALIFLQEQMATISELSFKKLMHYEVLGMHFLTKLLDDVYGNLVQKTKYDLIVIMQSMQHAYMNKLLFSKVALNFEELSTMLVEKVNILAHHSKQYILTESSLRNTEVAPIDCQILRQELEALKTEVSTPIQRQSVDTLIEEIGKEEPNIAIIFGVAHNLVGTNRGYWINNLLHNYFNAN
jgi:TetR/AcrR family transcriptional regulator, cholesterol catabolism regulator